jgi:hypothetical protein
MKDQPNHQVSMPRRRRALAAGGVLASGLVAGGVALSTLSSATATAATPAASTAAPSSAPAAGSPPATSGGTAAKAPAKTSTPVRSDEKSLSTSLTATLKAEALAAVPGGTVYRIESDAGDGVYEAHVTKADFSLVTVKFDKSNKVIKVETGMGSGDPAPAGGAGPGGGGPGGGRPGGATGGATG